MALDINGYNASFNAFVKFADDSMRTNAKAVARFGEGGAQPLEGRTIVAVDPKTDKVGKWGRSLEQQDLNNKIRTAFRNAIIDMFGGESNIPASVKKAMLLSDYGKGKPLTARRIIAVKTAIDATGVMKQKGAEEVLQPAALAKGYSKGEMPKLAKAANLLAQVKGCSVEQAFEEVTTQGSKANRLMNYGGRFLQSADNFKNGMRLLDSFSAWFDETCASLKEIHKDRDDVKFADGMSKTLLNGSPAVFEARCKVPVERFAFEEFANNPAANLAETDPNKLFGMENNQAMGSLGRHLQFSRSQTFAQVPPEKRTTFFKALNTMYPIYASNAREASIPPPRRGIVTSIDLGAPIARILKNLDQLIALDAKGKMTVENLMKLCFPEIPKPGKNPAADLTNLVKQWNTEMESKYSGDSYAMGEAMNATGCSLEDAFQIANGQKQLPNVPYYSSGTMEFYQMDGTPNAARSQLEGDLCRLENYAMQGSEEVLLKNEVGFKFNFPGGESLMTNKTQEGRANIPKVIAKLEDICGKVHPAQTSSLMMMTSQSGLGILKGGLKPYGFESSEHVPVDFTISKNDETGDISIRYSSPKELPFAFEWTATIKPDGSVSTTPMRFTDETALATLKRETTEAADKLKESTLATVRGRKGYDPAQGAMIAGKIGKSVDVIFSGVGADRDMLTLLQSRNMTRGILINGANEIRSPEKVANMVAGLKGNLDELRAAANGNQRVFDAGLKRIAKFGGTPLKSGILTKMCEMIAKEDLGAFRNLSAASSPEKIMDAMCRMDRLIAKIFDETKIMTTFGEVGGAETTTAKGLVMGLVFAHCDEDTANGIKSALDSQNATNLLPVLADMGRGNFPPGANVDSQTRVAISDNADTFQFTFIGEMYIALNESLGVNIDDAPWDVDKKTPVSPKSVNAIFDTIKEYTLEMQERRILRTNPA